MLDRCDSASRAPSLHITLQVIARADTTRFQ